MSSQNRIRHILEKDYPCVSVPPFDIRFGNHPFAPHWFAWFLRRLFWKSERAYHFYFKDGIWKLLLI